MAPAEEGPSSHPGNSRNQRSARIVAFDEGCSYINNEERIPELFEVMNTGPTDADLQNLRDLAGQGMKCAINLGLICHKVRDGETESRRMLRKAHSIHEKMQSELREQANLLQAREKQLGEAEARRQEAEQKIQLVRLELSSSECRATTLQEKVTYLHRRLDNVSSDHHQEMQALKKDHEQQIRMMSETGKEKEKECEEMARQVLRLGSQVEELVPQVRKFQQQLQAKDEEIAQITAACKTEADKRAVAEAASARDSITARDAIQQYDDLLPAMEKLEEQANLCRSQAKEHQRQARLARLEVRKLKIRLQAQEFRTSAAKVEASDDVIEANRLAFEADKADALVELQSLSGEEDPDSEDADGDTDQDG